MKVSIRQAVLDDILAHARDEAPNECCGLLIGSEGIIERAVRARNLESSPTRYVVDPVDHFAAIRAARAENRSIVGAYHSHPGAPPVPSERDRAEATYPDYLYLIVSPGPPDRSADILGYRLVDGNFQPVTFVPTP